MDVKKAKRLFPLALSAALMLAPVCSHASFNANFSTAEQKLAYLGVHSSEFVKVIVTPKNILPEDITADAVNTGSNIILKTTVTNENGAFAGNIILPDGFPYGCYLVAAFGDDFDERRLFVHSDAGTLASVSSQIKASDDPKKLIADNLSALGFDSGIFEDYGDSITEIAVSNMKSDDEFLNCYMTAEGTTLIKNGEMTLGEMLGLYEQFTGVNYAEEYLSESEDIRQAWEKTAAAQNYENESFDEKLNEARLLAKINALGRDAKEDVIAYFEANDVDLSDYEELTEYYQGKVFSALADNGEYLELTEFIDDFNDETDSQLDNQNKKSGGSGGSSGGSSSSSSSAGKLAFAADEKIAETDKVSFSDTVNHWAKDDIRQMAAKGIINGFDDGSFKPDKNITRAEFTKLIAGLLQLEEKTGNDFSDVTGNMWFAPFVYAAKNYGLINGVSDTSFAPDESITREDAAVIFFRLLEKKGITYGAEAEFADEEEISGYAKNAVLSLAHGGIINGSDGKFNPKNNLTRAEAAALLSRISQVIE